MKNKNMFLLAIDIFVYTLNLFYFIHNIKKVHSQINHSYDIDPSTLASLSPTSVNRLPISTFNTVFDKKTKQR